MAETAKQAAKVAGDRAHISALAAARLENRLVLIHGEEIERVDRHGPGGKRRRLAVAGDIIGALAIDLDRGEGRRRLHESSR